MYTLKLKNGDLDFSDRRCTVITGSDKLVQALGLWVSESLHVDRFHPQYGARLQDMVGSPQTEEFQYQVESELRRVVNEYILQQAEQFDRHPENFSKSEVIVQVLLVTSYFKNDALWCSVYVRTMAGTTVSLEQEVI